MEAPELAVAWLYEKKVYVKILIIHIFSNCCHRLSTRCFRFYVHDVITDPLRLSSRSRELLACQKFMTILMGHKAACVALQLKSTADCGSGRMSQLFKFFLYFLDLGFSQEFIASDQKQETKS